MTATREPPLVLRFAIASLLAFVLVGAMGMVLMVRYARERAELTGVFHARFVADAVLAPALTDIDLSRPVRGDDYRRVLEVVRERILADGRDVRVKVWRPDGTIVFSDDVELVGMRFPQEARELAEVMEGHVESGISDLDDAENVNERRLADKLLFAYVPLRVDTGGPVVAVAELYQDYAAIKADIDAFVSRMAPLLLVGLLILYAAILPIAVRVSRELRRRNEELRTHLENEQRTVSELRDLNRKKDDFVSAASHELRTPLTAITGALRTLKQPRLGEDPALREELLESADRQARRLERLISSVLSAARLDGTAPRTIEPVDLETVVRAAAEGLGSANRVRIEVPPQPVEMDRGRISTVLTYLLDNALKYSPEDEAVQVGASVGEEGFRLWVTDRGEGIDPADQDVIFERFHQLDQSATRVHGGLGLGLYLAKVLVEEVGGRIDVASTRGRGSTFTVVMPIGGTNRSPGSRAQIPVSLG